MKYRLSGPSTTSTPNTPCSPRKVSAEDADGLKGTIPADAPAPRMKQAFGSEAATNSCRRGRTRGSQPFTAAL
jgi:hypothetical protein